MSSKGLTDLTKALVTKLGRESAQNEIRWIREALANPRSLLHVPDHSSVPQPLLDQKLAGALRDRLQDKPLQYIIGTQPFGDIEIKCRPPVLIPRPETEHWALKLAERFQPTPTRRVRILDLGCGTGCISLLLASIWPAGSVWAHGVDINPEAVKLALENAKDLGLATTPEAGRMIRKERIATGAPNVFTAQKADWTETNFLPMGCPSQNPAGFFDIIVCNPPYISDFQYEQLDSSVRDWEDHRALKGGANFYQALANRMAKPSAKFKPLIKRPGGVCVMEMDSSDAAVVREIFQKPKALKGLEFWTDQYGKKRALWGNTGRLYFLPIAEKFKIDDGLLVPRSGNERQIPKRSQKYVDRIAKGGPLVWDGSRGVWGIP